TAIKQIAPNLYTILLSHDPSYFDSVIYKQYPQIDLTLSGHTHGMQMGVRIGEKEYSPAQYLYPHFSGMYPQENGQKLYVSTGCGFNGFPFRVGVRPSVTLFILKTR
ncbi:MAG: metallophosphoesterase, partial [Bacteroidales bacterium]